jgi:transposase-like protein
MGDPSKYPKELMDRGIRLALEGERPIAYVARDLGTHQEALRKRVRRAEVDAGVRTLSVPTGEPRPSSPFSALSAFAAAEELDDLGRDDLRAVEEDEMPTAADDVQPCTRHKPRHDPVVDQRRDRIVITANDERWLEDGWQPGKARPCPKRERSREGRANARRAREME